MARTLQIVVLVVFGVFSVGVTLAEGYFGFLRLALRERWGMQMLIDLAIFAAAFLAWMVPDARARRITPWPYAGLVVVLGSLGMLAYLVRRSFVASASQGAGSEIGAAT
jgi:hypothetical protein